MHKLLLEIVREIILGSEEDNTTLGDCGAVSAKNMIVDESTNL